MHAGPRAAGGAATTIAIGHARFDALKKLPLFIFDLRKDARSEPKATVVRKFDGFIKRTHIVHGNHWRKEFLLEPFRIVVHVAQHRRLDAVRGGPAGRGLRDDLARWDREDIRTLTRLLDRLAAERQTRMQDPAESE